MSVGTTMEEFWQTTARSTIGERCQAIFNQELLSDVTFVVRVSQGGSESKTIPAHKFVLAIGSPVFYAMFYGKLAEKKDSVYVSDCEYDSLLELFRFLYSNEANMNPDNVMQLLYLAKKYMLRSLADKCSTYLKEMLDPSNVFHVLSDAKKYEEKDLLDHCWKVIEKEAEEAVKSDGFMTIEESVLEELVEKDSLTIKEVELFKAVDCWAGKECEKQGLVAEGSVKRRILGEQIVKGIRFPVMEQKEFADIVLDSGILTQKECFDMMKYFNSVLNTPVGFPEVARPGSLKMVSRFKSLNTGWNYSPGIYNSLLLSLSQDINLHGVRLFGSENGEYSVTLTLRFFESRHISTQEGTFLSKRVRSKLGDYQGFDIIFRPPIILKNHCDYMISALITGPPSWYGQDYFPGVEHSGVKFYFQNCSKSHTSKQKGQFAEFMFTLT